MDVDLITSISAVAASIGNIGPGLEIVRPAAKYSGIPEMGNGLRFGVCCWAILKFMQ
jgi:trk system potassium uptake protein